MPSYIDTKYVNLLSSRLLLFKRKNNGLYNFRCPFCGDSQKSKTKARGYFYQRRTDLFFRCHNCGQSSTFSNFLKQFDGETYKEYALERYKEGITGKGHNTPDPKIDYEQPKFHSKIELPKISDLDDDHFAKTYLVNRSIPPQFLNYLYYTDDFKTFVRKMTKRDYDLSENEQRIVIPFFDKDKQLITFQGRAFTNTKLRYITIKMNEDSSKIFGLDRLDLKKQFYIVEGPFDSMFLENSIAMAGSDIGFKGNDDIKKAMDNHQGTIIFDNEPRNKEIIKRMYDVVEKDYNLVVWPDDMRHKDINDMILSGMSKAEVQTIISNNTFAQLEALTKLSYFKKC